MGVAVKEKSMTEEEKASPWKRLEAALPKTKPTEGLKNAFQRNSEKRAELAKEALDQVVRPATQFEDDRQNVFQRHNALRNAARRDTTPLDQRVEKIEADKDRWQNKKVRPVAAAGTTLTPDLVELRKASDASRAARRNPPPPLVIDTDVLKGVTLVWRLEWKDGINLWRNWAETDFNKTSLNNAIQRRLALGQTLNAQLIQDAYEDCVKGGHLEPRLRTDAQGHVVKLRSDASRPAPTLFPHHAWPDELQAEDTAAKEAAVAAAEQEVKRALNLSFEELKTEARKNYKPLKAGDGRS
jgi:hypothetical protein